MDQYLVLFYWFYWSISRTVSTLA